MPIVTATATVAATAAKIINDSGVTSRVKMLQYSFSPTFVFTCCHNRMSNGIGIQAANILCSSSLARYHRFPSFCTSANVHETANATTTSSESTAQPSVDANKKDNSYDVIDAANMLDIRVGQIIRAWQHEEADSLYVEEVDVGEAEPRIICSGLVKYIPLHLLQDKKVVVLANLKPRNMRGIKSNGMLMAASDSSHENVELLEPPEGSSPGERIWFGSQDDKQNQRDPATPNQIQKKKIWESVQPHLKTDDSCTAMLGEYLMQTSAGVVSCRSLQNANIS